MRRLIEDIVCGGDTEVADLMRHFPPPDSNGNP